MTKNRSVSALWGFFQICFIISRSWAMSFSFVAVCGQHHEWSFHALILCSVLCTLYFVVELMGFYYIQLYQQSVDLALRNHFIFLVDCICTSSVAFRTNLVILRLKDNELFRWIKVLRYSWNSIKLGSHFLKFTGNHEWITRCYQVTLFQFVCVS